MVIGAGGVSQVVVHKCAQHNDVLGKISIASRKIEKCRAIADSVAEKGNFKVPATIDCFEIDVFDIEATKALIQKQNHKS